MSDTCLLILPLGGALLAVATVFACGYAFHWKCLNLVSNPVSFDLAKIWESGKMDQEINQMMTRRLDDMVNAFKVQIPMASMFLSQAREDKLKEQAHVELVKVIPEIKQLLLQSSALDELTTGPIKLILQKILCGWTYRMAALAGLAGLLVGLLELWLMRLC